MWHCSRKWLLMWHEVVLLWSVPCWISLTTLQGECIWNSRDQSDGLLQERRKSIAIALELCLSCTNPSKSTVKVVQNTVAWSISQLVHYMYSFIYSCMFLVYFVLKASNVFLFVNSKWWKIISLIWNMVSHSIMCIIDLKLSHLSIW